MIQSESYAELLASLAAAQNEFPTMPKSSQAYGYKYADLDTITRAIKPILHKYGIAYMQSVGGLRADEMTLTTRLFNGKGQYIEDTAALPVITSQKNNAAQTMGMSITYMRRYALCAMLGITSDEDTDANAPTVAEAKPQVRNKHKPSMKGGESTAAEAARIKELCAARYANGKGVFTREEIMLYSSYRQDRYTAAELIAFIENALRNRRADAPELGKPDTAQGDTAPLF